jgi:FixJ family two-component response regulator
LAKNAGVSEYLTKPYQEAELLSLIENALAWYAKLSCHFTLWRL